MNKQTNRSSLETSRSLLDRARNDDHAAWETIVELYSPLIWKWLRRKGLSEADAENVGQDVLLSIYKNLHSFQKTEENHSFRGWLRRFTDRRRVDFIRRACREPGGVGGSDAAARMAQVAQVEEEDSDAEFLRHQAVELIRGHFAERDWNVFLHSAVEGKPSKEVAAMFDMTPNAVEQVKKRIRRFIREEFAGLVEFK